jgi:hypothetical protein
MARTAACARALRTINGAVATGFLGGPGPGRPGSVAGTGCVPERPRRSGIEAGRHVALHGVRSREAQPAQPSHDSTGGGLAASPQTIAEQQGVGFPLAEAAMQMGLTGGD